MSKQSQYGFCQYIDHGNQVLKEQIEWFNVTDKQLSDKEQAAYEAGFQKAMRTASQLVSLHGNFYFKD